MNNKFRIDITTLIGQQFSLLKIQEVWRSEDNGIMVKCMCDCGNEWTGTFNSIKSFKTQSCGCRWNTVRKRGGLGY